jgi:hypothetical protein
MLAEVGPALGRPMVDTLQGSTIAARQFEAAGCRVLGVEPDARMAAFARGAGGGVQVEVARIEDWEPAGRIALFWHTFEMPRPVAQALSDVYHRVVPDAPMSFDPALQGFKLYQPGFTKAADGIRATNAFGPTEQWLFDVRSSTRPAGRSTPWAAPSRCRTRRSPSPPRGVRDGAVNGS